MKSNAHVAAASPSKCKFPSWLTASQHWHTLDYRRSYMFHKHDTTLRITNTTTQPVGSQHVGSGGTGHGYVTCVTQFIDWLVFKMSPISLSVSFFSNPSCCFRYHNNHGMAMSLGLTGDVSSNHQQHQEMRVVCTEVRQMSHDTAHLVTHFTMGW
jgi:hypothetical protein